MTPATADTYVPVKHPVLLLLTVMLCTVVITIDSTIANVALPHMQGALSTTQDQVSWVLTSYIVAATIMTPPSGFIAAKFGRQRFLLSCIGGFLIASMLCGAATSLSQIVFFRILQGAFGAGIVPIGQTIIMDHFPPAKRAQVLSIWGMGTMLGPIVGPSFGGYLTETLSWRWVFYINVPLCVLAAIGILAVIPKTKNAQQNPFDFIGFALVSLFIGALQLMLDRGHSLYWFQSLEIIIEATVAGLCLYLFVVHMVSTKHPFIQPRLFKDRNLFVGLCVMAVTQVLTMGQMALLPNFLQQLMHIPVDTTGYLLMPRGIAMVVGMAFTGWLINYIDARYVMIIGLLAMSFSTYEMAHINLNVSTQTILMLGIEQGFGMSLFMAPMTGMVFATLAPIWRAEGAAMTSLMRNMGGSVGISIFFTRIAEETQINHQRLGENITAFTTDLPKIWDWHSTAGAMTLDSEITRQASSVAYLDVYMVMAVCFLLVIPLCLLFKKAERTSVSVASMAAEH